MNELDLPNYIQEKMIRLGDWLIAKWPILRKLA